MSTMQNPVTRQEVQLPPLMSFRPLNLDDESDEEEIIFTRNMITRLNDSLVKQGEKPVPVSKERIKKNSKGSAGSERNGSATRTRVNSATRYRGGSATVTAPDPSLLKKEKLSEDELAAVVQEINGYAAAGMDMSTLSIRPDGGDIVANKKYYFRTRLAELHNLMRLLNQRKEEALDREQYATAAGIDKCLKTLTLREEPLKELLIERMDAVNNADYMEAQKMKDKYDLNLEAAMDIPDLDKFVSQKEMARIRAEAKNST